MSQGRSWVEAWWAWLAGGTTISLIAALAVWRVIGRGSPTLIEVAPKKREKTRVESTTPLKPAPRRPLKLSLQLESSETANAQPWPFVLICHPRVDKKQYPDAIIFTISGRSNTLTDCIISTCVERDSAIFEDLCRAKHATCTQVSVDHCLALYYALHDEQALLYSSLMRNAAEIAASLAPRQPEQLHAENCGPRCYPSCPVYAEVFTYGNTPHPSRGLFPAFILSHPVSALKCVCARAVLHSGDLHPHSYTAEDKLVQLLEENRRFPDKVDRTVRSMLDWLKVSLPRRLSIVPDAAKSNRILSIETARMINEGKITIVNETSYDVSVVDVDDDVAEFVCDNASSSGFWVAVRRLAHCGSKLLLVKGGHELRQEHDSSRKLGFGHIPHFRRNLAPLAKYLNEMEREQDEESKVEWRYEYCEQSHTTLPLPRLHHGSSITALSGDALLEWLKNFLRNDLLPEDGQKVSADNDKEGVE